MTEWLDTTRQEFAAFTAGNAEIKDPILRSLTDIAQSLHRAWKNNRCQTCPLAECAATAAATLQFYKEQHK